MASDTPLPHDLDLPDDDDGLAVGAGMPPEALAQQPPAYPQSTQASHIPTMAEMVQQRMAQINSLPGIKAQAAAQQAMGQHVMGPQGAPFSSEGQRNYTGFRDSDVAQNGAVDLALTPSGENEPMPGQLGSPQMQQAQMERDPSAPPQESWMKPQVFRSLHDWLFLGFLERSKKLFGNMFTFRVVEQEPLEDVHILTDRRTAHSMTVSRAYVSRRLLLARAIVQVNDINLRQLNDEDTETIRIKERWLAKFQSAVVDILYEAYEEIRREQERLLDELKNS